MGSLSSNSTAKAGSPLSMAAGVLLLEDNAILGDLFERSLQRRGCDVKRFSLAEEVDSATNAGMQGVLVSDMWLAGSMNGVQLIERLRERGDQRPAMIISGESNKGVERAALAAGASCFLLKPFSLEELGQVVERMLDCMPITPLSAPSNH